MSFSSEAFGGRKIAMRHNSFRTVLCLALSLTTSACFAKKPKKGEYLQHRMKMIKTQIEKRGIKTPKLLRALQKVERHRFVPDNQKEFAYQDSPLPIGFDQTISQPYIVAFMTDALDINPGDRVLEIGTGSGYQAAVLAELAKEVYSIEIVAPLAKRTIELFKSLPYENVNLKIGDGYQGWPEKAPFEKIILTAAPAKIPQKLIDQLKVGGRLVAPVGTWNQKLILLKKTENGIEKQTLLMVRFVPMTGEAQKKK